MKRALLLRNKESKKSQNTGCGEPHLLPAVFVIIVLTHMMILDFPLWLLHLTLGGIELKKYSN
jgi:hypothetical protein